VADLHPSFFLNKVEWDSIYWKENPIQLVAPAEREPAEILTRLETFAIFLKRIKALEKSGLFRIGGCPSESHNEISITRQIAIQGYQHSIRWPRRWFSYEPKFLEQHFLTFFDVAC